MKDSVTAKELVCSKAKSCTDLRYSHKGGLLALAPTEVPPPPPRLSYYRQIAAERLKKIGIPRLCPAWLTASKSRIGLEDSPGVQSAIPTPAADTTADSASKLNTDHILPSDRYSVSRMASLDSPAGTWRYDSSEIVTATAVTDPLDPVILDDVYSGSLSSAASSAYSSQYPSISRMDLTAPLLPPDQDPWIRPFPDDGFDAMHSSQSLLSIARSQRSMSDLSEIYATYSDLWYPRGAEDHNDRFPKSPCQEEPEHAKPCLGGQVDDKAPSSPLPPSLAASSTSASVRSTHTLYSSFEDVGSIPDGSYHGNGSAKARSGGPSVRGKLRSKSVAVLRHVRSLVHAPLRFTSHRPPPSGKQQGIAAYRNTAEFVPIDNTHIATSFLGSEPGDLNCISLVSPNRKYLVRGIAASKGSQPELSGPQRARWSESRGQWVISKPIGGLSAQVSAADKKKLRPIKDMQGWWEDIMRGIQHGKLVMSGEGKPPAACHQWSQPQPCGSERGEAVFITLPEHMYLAPQTPGLYKSGAMAAVTTGSLPVALHSNSDLARPASTPAGWVKRSSESLRLHCTAAAVGCSPIGECSPSSSTATPLSLNSEWGEDCTGGPAEWTLGDTENTIGGSSSSYAEPILKSPPCAQDEHASGHLKGSPKHRLALGRTIITSVRSKLTHLASSLAKPPPSGVEISLPSQVGQAVSPHSEPSPCEPRSKAGGITVPSTGIEARSPIATSAMNSLAAGLKRMTNRWNAK